MAVAAPALVFDRGRLFPHFSPLSVMQILSCWLRMLVVPLLFAALLPSHADAAPPRQALSPVRLYADFALARHAKDFPPDRDALRRCQRAKDAPCLRLYRKVLSARQQILARVSEPGLRENLALIRQFCRQAEEPASSLACSGAVMAWAFYRDPALDALLLAEVQALDDALRSHVFNEDDTWLGLRPAPQRWAAYLQHAPLAWATPEAKRIALANLHTPPPPPSWLSLPWR